MTRVALIALLAFAGATTRAADPAADEVKKLRGEWQAVEVEVKGKKAGKDDAEVKNLRLVFEGDGITLPSPAGDGKDRRVATLSLRADRLPAAELGGVLDQAFDIAVRPGLHCAPYIHRSLGTFPEGTVRVSVGPFNTAEDVDALAEGLAEILA